MGKILDACNHSKKCDCEKDDLEYKRLVAILSKAHWSEHAPDSVLGTDIPEHFHEQKFGLNEAASTQIKFYGLAKKHNLPWAITIKTPETKPTRKKIDYGFN